MTRTEFLSLADALRFNGRYGYETQDQSAERRINERASAAAILRKLAELRPVAWCLGLPQYAHSSNIIAANEFTPDAEHRDEWAALYQLSEVLTDE